MIKYSQRRVILVPFPFSNQTTSKKRPAVIVSSDEYNLKYYDVVIMAITSNIDSNDKYILNDWKNEGLLKPSILKPVISTIDKSLIIKELGKLTDKDFSIVKIALNDIFDIK